MKSEKFEVGLLDSYHIRIPKYIAEPFINKKHKRVKVEAWFKCKNIEFYAALKKDKVSNDFSMMFGKRYQRALGLFQNDYFEMQLFEDTSKYGVDMPEELNAVFLSDYEAFKIFEALTAGKKRSIIYAVLRYKSTQTRIDKALVMCENLKKGEINPMQLFKN